MSLADLMGLDHLARYSSVVPFFLWAVTLCLAVAKHCGSSIYGIFALKPGEGSGRERVFPQDRAVALYGVACGNLVWAGILFSQRILANPNLQWLKSEMLQLNISDMRSGLELSSLKYYVINRLAYHLQYGNLKYF